MNLTPSEDNRLHQIEKKAKRYQFGTTAELAGNMMFLLEIIHRLQSELTTQTAENNSRRGPIRG